MATIDGLSVDELRSAVDFARARGWKPPADDPSDVCATCGIVRENCKPGGQWYSRCPFRTDGDHIWTSGR